MPRDQQATKPKTLIMVRAVEKASAARLGLEVMMALIGGHDVDVRISDGELKGISVTYIVMDDPHVTA